MIKILANYKNNLLTFTWIPNSLSLMNSFLGFLSIIYSYTAGFLNQHHLFVHSTILICIASILDILDGRIARRIKHPNPIGKELDSFADFVTFGIAPAMLFYSMIAPQNPFYPSPMNHYPLLVAFISFLFPMSNALRLSKFNLLQYQNFFVGMPTPAAALSTSLFLTFNDFPNSPILNLSFYHIPLEWWSAMSIFIFYAILMNVKIIFPKQIPPFFKFSKKSFSQNYTGLLSLITLLLFLKFFLILYVLFYTFKPILTSSKKLKRSSISPSSSSSSTQY